MKHSAKDKLRGWVREGNQNATPKTWRTKNEAISASSRNGCRAVFGGVL